MDFWKGESTELLKALHILTRDGKLNADSRRKLKQVYHLTQLIDPIIRKLLEKHENPVIADMGAGKSYLGFILYDLILRQAQRGQIVSIESRPDLVSRSRDLAQASGFERMDFIDASIQSAKINCPLHLVCALHACDTATDDAIGFGLQNQVEAFALVPCCQAEVARSLERKIQNPSALQALHHFPIHRREFGSHLTNVIRTLALQSQGYKVTVTELVGWEHSMKNELILAEKISTPAHPKSVEAKNTLQALLSEFGLEMGLLKLDLREL